MYKKIITTILLLVLATALYIVGTKINFESSEKETELPAISTQEILKKLFAEKYDKDISDITVTIVRETERHALGGVKFSTDPQAEGGMFLAAKDNDIWRITYDGNGQIDCSAVEPYNFPADMAPECVENGILIDRTTPCLSSDGKSMKISEARQIAVKNECGDHLKDTYYCNENSGTWWIDLTTEKQGCAPACVIDVKTKKAEINWRCTGLITPTQ